MRGTVNAAADLADGIKIQSNNFASGEMSFKGLNRNCIGFGIPKFCGHHGPIANVEIGIGGHEIFGLNATGFGFGDHFNRQSCCQHGLMGFECRRVKRIIVDPLFRQIDQDTPRPGEAGKAINMVIRARLCCRRTLASALQRGPTSMLPRLRACAS